MPKVTTYERRADIGSVNLNAPKMSPAVPENAFGAGFAKSLGSLGNDLGQVSKLAMESAKRMQDEEDEAKALEAYTRYHDAVSTYVQGDGTEGTGVYNRMGGAALGATKEAKAQLEKDLRDIGGTLDNDRQRLAFNRRAQTLRMESLDSVSRHEAKERRAYQVETLKAVAGKESSYALINYTNPDRVEAGLSRMSEAASKSAKLAGLPPEAEEKLIGDMRSDALKKVALRHVKTGQYDEARRWMEDERLTGEDRAAVQDALRPAEVADKADVLAEKMLAMGITRQDAQKYLLDNVDDLAVRTAAKSTFSALYASKKADETAARQEAIYNAMDTIDSMEGDLAAQYRFVNSLPEGPVKRQADARYRQYSSFAGLGFKTDPAAYEDLADKIVYAEITSEKVLTADPLAVKVAQADLDRLKRSLGAKQRVTEGDLKNAWLVANGIQNDGTVPVSLSDEQKRDLFNFKRWAESKTTETNRADDPAFLQKLADAWVMPGEKKGGRWRWDYGPNNTFGESLADPTWLPDTPDEVRAQIEQKFSANESVRAAWLKKYDSKLDLAIRGYHRAMIESGFAPLSREKE